MSLENAANGRGRGGKLSLENGAKGRGRGVSLENGEKGMGGGGEGDIVEISSTTKIVRLK